MVGSASSGWPRARRAGRFLVLVLGIALCFQALVGGAQRLVAWTFNTGALRPALGLPNVRSNCDTVATAAPPQALSAPVARAGCLHLGFNLGIATASRNAGDAPALANTLAAQRATLAQGLGVATPEVPPVIHTAEVLHEFEVHLEADPQCTAARLAKTFTPECGGLYQFGAALGHAWLYRTRMPQLGPLFVPQLSIYGDRARLSPALWAPLAADLSSVSGDQARQQLQSAVQGIERAVGAQP